MRIFIDKETLIPRFPVDQIMMIGEFQTVYKQFGWQGIMYTILFGWQGSPYVNGTVKEDERDMMIMDHLDSTDIYDPVKEEFLTKWAKKAKDMYKLPAIKAGVKQINVLCPVALLELANFYDQESTNIKKAIKDIQYESDPEKNAKNAAAKAKLFDTLEKITKQQELTNEKIKVIMDMQTEASLNDFLPNYQSNQRNG